eukprot:2270457-Prymnesium_polylepis.1
MDTARWLVTKEVPTAGDFHDDDWVADMMLTDQGHHEALVKVLCDDDSVAFAHTQFCYDLCAQFARGKDNKMMVCRKMVAIAQAAAAVGRQSALSDKELSERAFELNSTIQTGIGVLIDACGGTEKAYQLIISEHGMKMVLAAVQGDCQVALAKHSFQSAIDFLWLGGLFNALHTSLRRNSNSDLCPVCPCSPLTGDANSAADTGAKSCTVTKTIRPTEKAWRSPSPGKTS